MYKVLLTIILSFSFLHANSITVAVAANVGYAMEDLKKEFCKLHPQIDLKVILGSSGKLTAQIINGAPYQLFISADMNYPQTLYTSKYATTRPVVYALGSLAYFSTKKLNFKDIYKELKSYRVSTIAIANPLTAPYGRASVEALKNADIYHDVKHKFIYGESISQTISYAIKAADIGIIAKSSLYSIHMQKYKENENFKELDSKLYTPIKQGVVILKEGKDNPYVKAFYDFLLSQKGQKIFNNFGYIVP